MSEPRPYLGKMISYLIVLLLVVACAITSVLLRWLGNWEEHAFGLKLAERIVWGCGLVGCLATVLTRVTMFGWYFRRYFRWPGEGAGAPTPPVPLPRRPATAPWYKSGKASFTITVVLVSLTGAIAIATVVMWTLTDVTGEWTFLLVFKILWSVWWVLAIATVLTRNAIFRWHMKAGRAEQTPPPPPAKEGPGETLGAQS